MGEFNKKGSTMKKQAGKKEANSRKKVGRMTRKRAGGEGRGDDGGCGCGEAEE